MDYKGQIKALRLRVPISIQEALLRLKAHQGDVELVEQEFIEHCVASICKQTNISREVAFTRFKELKYDLTKTISSIREEEYNRNYTQPPGLTREKLKLVTEWLVMEDREGLNIALYYHLDSVIATLSLMSVLSDLTQALKAAEMQKQRIQGQYKDTGLMDLDTYVNSVNTLKTTVEYKKCEELLSQKMYILEKELSRHLRNIK